MLPDPAKPQPDEPPRDTVRKPSALIPALLSLATFAIAIVLHRINRKEAEVLPNTTVSTGENEPEAKVMALATLENSEPVLPFNGETKPLALQQPFIIDVKRNRFDYVGLVISVLSFIATVVIAISAYLINWRHADAAQLQADAAIAQVEAAKAQAIAATAQADAAEDEANIKFVEEFRERLSDFALPTDDSTKPAYDENVMRKSLAIIALAQHGERVLPALKMTLENSDHVLRDGAVNVLAQMLSNQRNKESREKIFFELLQYFKNGDVNMRYEILGSFNLFQKEVRPLYDDEIRCAKEVFRTYISPHADISNKVREQEVLMEAAAFFGNWPPYEDSIEFLSAIVENPASGSGPQEQAKSSLRVVLKDARDLSPELKKQITDILERR